MRLHELRVTAFGPFATSQRVDFDALSAGGLFLLHGATGAGKTSVLDAVCYALYGAVPGDRQQARRLRSDHAPADLRPQVELSVTLSGRRLEITRCPEWDRPKRRGVGVTREQASVLVTELVGAERRPLATRHDEAGQLVTDLAGLNANQFCQVAMLPQGQFATFLRADAEQRGALLERLFDTWRFSWAADWLATRARDAEAELRQAERAAHSVLERTLEATGQTEPPPLDEAAAWAGDLRTAAGARLEQARAVAATAARDQRQARDEVSAASELMARQQAHQEARQRADQLAAGAAERDALAAELAAARRANAVAAALDAAERARVDLSTAAAAWTAATAELAARGGPSAQPDSKPAGPADQGAADRHADTVRAAARAWREEVGRLEELAGDVAEHGAVEAELGKLVADQAMVETELTRIAGELAGYPERQAAALARVERARKADARAAALADQVTLAQGRHAAAVRREELAAELAARDAALDAAAERALAARSAWLDARQLRLDGMAAELAAGLAPGMACPVCGATAHPAPADPADGQVTRAQEDAAGQRAERAEQDRRAAEEAVGTLRALLAEARALAGGDEPSAQLANAAAGVAAEHSVAAAEAAALDVAERALAALSAAQDEDRAAEAELREAAAALAARALDARGRLASLARTLAAAQGEDPDIPARQARIGALAGAAEQVLTAHARLADAVERRHAAQARAADEAAAAGFADLAAAQAALRADQRLAEAEERLLEHERERAAVAERLADPALIEAAGLPPADPERAAARLASADAALAAAEAEQTRAADQDTALRRLGGQLATALAALAPQRERHETAHRMARLVNGGGTENARKMTLSSYVLAARLEQVAAAASERLSRMSSGRYTIAHSDALAGRGKRSGLGLLVRDAWTGVDRAPATLSGGESFFTSLALALGLADVVTAEAGGARLETLFIDEGFGSLDAEALEDVMDALDGLRDHGRVVGLVSHVAELRSRIPAQLRVAKGRAGSVLCQD